MRRFTITLLSLTCLTLFAGSGSAQTGSRISLQISALASAPFGGGLSEVSAGAGFEAQVRYNPGAFGVGVGFEYSSHSLGGTDRSIRLTGAFAEPRYVLDSGSDTYAPYLSARLAVSQVRFEVEGLTDNASGFTANVGGGLLFVARPGMNFDLGFSVGAKDLGSASIPTDPVSIFALGSGLNVILRVGFAIGL
jgi:hypothetical protein